MSVYLKSSYVFDEENIYALQIRIDKAAQKIQYQNCDKKVWWKCSKGHEWQAAIGSRNRGSGCPECAREKRRKTT